MFLDFHTHIFPPGFREGRTPLFHGESSFKLLYNDPGARLVGKKEIIENMDVEGIHKSVVFGFPWKNADHYKKHNDYIIEAVEQYPERLMGFSCFDIMSLDAAKEAERCLDAGLSGVGELAVYESGFSVEVISALADIMAVCRERNVPLMLHTNEPVGHQYPGKQPMQLKELYELLKAYPLNKIVLAHWGGGIFFYSLMKKEVQDVLLNVWFDTAASPFLYTPDIYKVAGKIAGFDKILMGSDFPLLKPGRYIKEMKAGGLTEDEMKNICGENGARLLGS